MKQLTPLIWFALAFAVATLITAASMADWCRWDEFGLNRLPAFLAVGGLLVAAALCALVGVFRLRRGMGGVSMAIALGLFLGAVISPRFVEPRCMVVSDAADMVPTAAFTAALFLVDRQHGSYIDD